jgi:hypothetical protein
LKLSLENCINSDLKNLEALLQKIRISFIIKYLKITSFHYGFRAYENICILHFLNNEVSTEFAKLEKKRIFIEFSKHENYLIVRIKSIKKKLNIFLFYLNKIDDHFSYKR